MYNPRYIIDVLADNIRKTRNPFGAGNGTVNRWWKGNDLPSQGDTLLFTGLMYQLMPFIKKTTHHIERFEDTKMADYVWLQKYVPKLMVKLGFVFMADKKDKEASNRIFGIHGQIAREIECESLLPAQTGLLQRHPPL